MERRVDREYRGNILRKHPGIDLLSSEERESTEGDKEEN